MNHGHALRLHSEDDIVDRLGLFAKLFLDRHHARDVGAVGVILAAGVDEEVEFVGPEGGIVGGVMQCRSGGSGGDDGVVSLLCAAVGHAGGDERRPEVAFIGGGAWVCQWLESCVNGAGLLDRQNGRLVLPGGPAYRNEDAQPTRYVLVSISCSHAGSSRLHSRL